MTAGANDPHLGLVVEGRGDLGAVPILLRTALHRRDDYRELLGKPVACHGRDKALRPGGVEGYVRTAAGRPGCRAVLVVLDAEGDPACQLGPRLLERATSVTHHRVVVALAEPKFEAWLVASAENLGLGGLVYRPEVDPEGLIRKALSAKYVKPQMQPRLTSAMDLDLAQSRSPSLARLLTRLEALRALIPASGS